MLFKFVLADVTVSASGDITLEIKEPKIYIQPINVKSASIQSELTGFSMKKIEKNDIVANHNNIFLITISFLLIITAIFNIYNYLRSVSEQKTISE